MNAAQIGAALNANKPVVLGTAAAAVAGLALLQRRKTASGATPAGPATRTAGATVPAAAVVPGGYDSSASDVANWLAPQLEALRQTSGRSGVTDAPAPVASQLFSPSYTGNYVRGQNGAIAEVESDGSLFGLTGDQWGRTTNATYTQLAGELPFVFSTEANLKTANAPKS